MYVFTPQNKGENAVLQNGDAREFALADLQHQRRTWLQHERLVADFFAVEFDGALVDHAPEQPKPVAAVPPAPPVASAPPPAPKPIESIALGNEPAPAIAPSSAAPALPPATAVPGPTPFVTAPVAKADADHPVPPESIPGAPPLSLEPKSADTSNRSRLGELIADIPLLGRVIEPKGN